MKRSEIFGDAVLSAVKIRRSLIEHSEGFGKAVFERSETLGKALMSAAKTGANPY